MSGVDWSEPVSLHDYNADRQVEWVRLNDLRTPCSRCSAPPSRPRIQLGPHRKLPDASRTSTSARSLFPPLQHPTLSLPNPPGWQPTRPRPVPLAASRHIPPLAKACQLRPPPQPDPDRVEEMQQGRERERVEVRKASSASREGAGGLDAFQSCLSIDTQTAAFPFHPQHPPSRIATDQGR